MTDEEFTQVVEDRAKKTAAILTRKASEYARGDRLSNFKKAAQAMSTIPEKACISFWMKHVISVCDLVNDVEAGKSIPEGMWDEKIGDAVNYLILLEALIVERDKNNVKPSSSVGV